MEVKTQVHKNSQLSKLLILLLLTALLVFQAFAGYRVYTLSRQQEIIRTDYSTVNSIIFGLLSISEWRDKLTVVLSAKLHNFSLSKDQLDNLEAEVEEILHALINKAVSIINEKQETMSGKLKKIAFNTFIDKDKLHAQVPEFSKVIIQKVNSPSSKKRLTRIAESKMNEFEKEIYDSTEFVEKTITDSLFQKYQVNNLAEFEKQTNNSVLLIKQGSQTYAFCMLACIVILLLLWWVFRKKTDYHTLLFVFSVLSAFVLLLVGISCTMIEVDARIEKLQMTLLGKDISFHNQVLFFQSKSILAVVKILLSTGDYDSVAVGILLLTFSILFPAFKLASLGIYKLGKSRWTKSGFISYFAFKSGKWSMADVMVIGILMTYIGFNSIIESQLEHLNIQNEALTSITTNKTALQPGYIVFVGFVVYGLILSEILKRITKHKELEMSNLPG